MQEQKRSHANVIIFGGSGFIGTHLSRYLLENHLVETIYCVDLVNPRCTMPHLIYIRGDVRKPLNIQLKNDETIAAIYNFAAVHTTPGYEDHEYFETNICGAQNVCDFASQKNISNIIFTSSISPYGASELKKMEDTLLEPTSAYGTSKAIAEYIHQIWLAADPKRKLTIVRPGVVFGAGEGGNFTRLYQSLRHKYFFFPGRKDTKKACIYVKDVVRALYEMSQSQDRFQLYNLCYPEAPTIETIVTNMADILKLKCNYWVIPAFLLKFVAGICFLGEKIIGIPTDIRPARIDKLIYSTNISGEKLAQSPYALKFSLQEALFDWYKECQQKGLY